jgi:mRNA interferase MazF
MAKAKIAITMDEKLLSTQAWVKVSQIRTLSTERIGKKIGQVSAEEMDRIVDGLNEIIG